MSFTPSEKTTTNVDGPPRAAIAGESECFDLEYLVSARIVHALLSLLFYTTIFWVTGMILLGFLDLPSREERTRAMIWQSIVTLSAAFWFWGRGATAAFLRNLRRQRRNPPSSVA